jgi:HPt (histidine-containing phosphotransfer) domain-containing protein
MYNVCTLPFSWTCSQHPRETVGFCYITLVSQSLVSDLDAALDALEGDRELLQRIVDLFLLQAPQLLEEVREAISRQDAFTLERAAHKLRGSVTNFAAKNTYDAALRLESMGHGGDLAQALEAQAQLERALGELQATLVEFGKDRA